MKFIYEYRTSDNALHHGVVAAANREAAFAALKAKGVRPAGLREAPGFANKLFGKGKRWMAILALVLIAGVLSVRLLKVGREAEDQWQRAQVMDRAQVYGDPGLLKVLSDDGWAKVFADLGDRYLALHAVPGLHNGCDGFLRRNAATVEKSLKTDVMRQVEIGDGDYEEVKTIKRIVNGMRCELRDYLAAGGEVKGFVERVEERSASEVQIYNRIRRELQMTADATEWTRRNAELRAMGLPMVNPEEELEKGR